MRRTWTIIGVGDVTGSFKWYQLLLGLPETAPAHDYFGQILDSDGTVLLCLHEWGAHEHPSLVSPDHAQPGNGLLLFFRVDDFDTSLERARALVARLEEEPHVNPNTETTEFLPPRSGRVLRHDQCSLSALQPNEANQAMQRTASKAATGILRVCHPHFGCVARCTGLAVADLVSR